MTRTEIQRRELEETARHNKEQEKLGLYGAITNTMGSYGALMRGYGALKPKTQTHTTNNYKFIKQERGRRK